MDIIGESYPASINYLLYNKMMENGHLKLHDVVALMKDMPEKKLLRGQVGTIVHQYSDNDFEVEFTDKTGSTIELLTLSSSLLMLLHYDAVN